MSLLFSQIGQYAQTGGNPTDDTSALGGSPDFTTVLTPTTNTYISSPTILGSLQQYRAVGASRIDYSGGTLSNSRVSNRCGGIIPPAAGIFTVASSSPADTGVLWICYLLSGVWTIEELTLNGTNAVTGANAWDADNWMVVWEGVSHPVGNLSLVVNGAQIGVMFGMGDNPTGQDISTGFVSSLYDVALATAQDTAISAADRRSDPTSGISSYAKATRWQGADASLSVPGGTMLGSVPNWIAWIVRLNLPAGMPKPFGNILYFLIDLIGDPS